MKAEEIEKRSVKGLVNVAQLLKEHVGSSRDYDVAEIINRQASNLIKGRVRFTRTGQGILVQGKLTVELEMVCSRCLDDFACPLDFSIEEEFFPTVDVSTGLPLSFTEGTEGFTIDNNHMFDLGELICQYVLLSLPMKPLCSADCVGIRR
jgi:uncharacterized protein